jgi:shikimate kinase
MDTAGKNNRLYGRASLMNIEQHLILTGFMGSGKSSVGRKLAGILEKPFVDLDEYIEQQTGSTIVDIFA